MFMGLRGVWVVLVASTALGITVGCGEDRQFAMGTAGASAGSDRGGSKSTSGAATSGAATSGAASSGAPAGGAAAGETNGGENSGPCTPGATKTCWERADGSAFDSPRPSADQTTCRIGESKCGSDGTYGPCNGAVPPEAADTCEPGNDASCNGVPNEGCVCTDGTKRACGSDVGNCTKGEQTCKDAAWGPCLNEVAPAPNDGCAPGDDANCNGKPNELCTCVNGDKMDCGSNVGSCMFGSKTCVNGVYPAACEGGVTPAAADTCEPKNDANCNGAVNENCKCTGSEQADCGVAVGTCKLGKQTCVNGKLGECLGGVSPTTNDTCLAANAANDTNCNGKFRDGCQCVATDPPDPCGECGHRACDGKTGTWGACVGDNTPRCNPNAPDNKQVCGAAGVWVASDCAAGSVCRDAGASCKLKNGQVCTAPAQCDTAACTVFYLDADSDKYPANNTQVKLCGATNAGYVAMASALAVDCTGGSGDSSAAVHPGATEVCDGIDNNCNNAIDDGLPLGGSILQVGDTTHSRRFPAIAWAPEKSLYGIVYRDNDEAAVAVGQYFVTYNQAGTPQLTPANMADVDWDNYTVGLTWGGSVAGFGFAYANHGEVFFRAINANGSGGLIKSIYAGESSNPRVARTSTGWGILYLDYGSGSNLVEAKTLSDAGDLSAQIDIVDSSSVNAELTSTPTRLVTAVSLAGNTAQATAWNASFASPASLTVNGSSPALGSGPDGFAIAVKGVAGTQPTFYSYDNNGGGKCAAVKFGDGTFAPSSIVGTSTGYFVLSEDTKLRGQQIRSDCTVGPLFTIDAAANASYSHVSGGTAGYGVVWANDIEVRARFFGPLFCK
jgi:hypothetical protein